MMFFETIKRIKSLMILTAIAMFMCVGFAGVTAAAAQTSLPGKKLEGRIRVSGAWALYPMMVKWADEFKNIHPGVRIDISAGGAGKGVTDALSGLVDIGMVSRDLRPEELKQNAFYVPVVKDAVFPTISAANPVMKELTEKGLRKKDFNNLWLSGRSMTWGDVTRTDNHRHIRVYTRSDSCGAAETWAKYLGAYQEDLKGIAVYGDPGIAEAIRKDKNGIGYNNLNYAYDLKTGLPVPGIRIVPIDVNENGRIDPGEKLDTKHDAIKAVQSGVYPSPPARDLYLVTKGAFQGATKEFVKWILSDGQRYVEEVGYLKINASQLKNAVRKIGP